MVPKDWEGGRQYRPDPPVLPSPGPDWTCVSIVPSLLRSTFSFFYWLQSELVKSSNKMVPTPTRTLNLVFSVLIDTRYKKGFSQTSEVITFSLLVCLLSLFPLPSIFSVYQRKNGPKPVASVLGVTCTLFSPISLSVDTWPEHESLRRKKCILFPLYLIFYVSIYGNRVHPSPCLCSGQTGHGHFYPTTNLTVSL